MFFAVRSFSRMAVWSDFERVIVGFKMVYLNNELGGARAVPTLFFESQTSANASEKR